MAESAGAVEKPAPALPLLLLQPSLTGGLHSSDRITCGSEHPNSTPTLALVQAQSPDESYSSSSSPTSSSCRTSVSSVEFDSCTGASYLCDRDAMLLEGTSTAQAPRPDSHPFFTLSALVSAALSDSRASSPFLSTSLLNSTAETPLIPNPTEKRQVAKPPRFSSLSSPFVYSAPRPASFGSTKPAASNKNGPEKSASKASSSANGTQKTATSTPGPTSPLTQPSTAGTAPLFNTHAKYANISRCRSVATAEPPKKIKSVATIASPANSILTTPQLLTMKESLRQRKPTAKMLMQSSAATGSGNVQAMKPLTRPKRGKHRAHLKEVVPKRGFGYHGALLELRLREHQESLKQPITLEATTPGDHVKVWITNPQSPSKPSPRANPDKLLDALLDDPALLSQISISISMARRVKVGSIVTESSIRNGSGSLIHMLIRGPKEVVQALVQLPCFVLPGEVSARFAPRFQLSTAPPNPTSDQLPPATALPKAYLVIEVSLPETKTSLAFEPSFLSEPILQPEKGDQQTLEITLRFITFDATIEKLGKKLENKLQTSIFVVRYPTQQRLASATASTLFNLDTQKSSVSPGLTTDEMVYMKKVKEGGEEKHKLVEASFVVLDRPKDAPVNVKKRSHADMEPSPPPHPQEAEPAAKRPASTPLSAEATAPSEAEVSLP